MKQLFSFGITFYSNVFGFDRKRSGTDFGFQFDWQANTDDNYQTDYQAGWFNGIELYPIE